MIPALSPFGCNTEQCPPPSPLQEISSNSQLRAATAVAKRPILDVEIDVSSLNSRSLKLHNSHPPETLTVGAPGARLFANTNYRQREWAEQKIEGQDQESWVFEITQRCQHWTVSKKSYTAATAEIIDTCRVNVQLINSERAEHVAFSKSRVPPNSLNVESFSTEKVDLEVFGDLLWNRIQRNCCNKHTRAFLWDDFTFAVKVSLSTLKLRKLDHNKVASLLFWKKKFAKTGNSYTNLYLKETKEYAYMWANGMSKNTSTIHLEITELSMVSDCRDQTPFSGLESC